MPHEILILENRHPCHAMTFLAMVFQVSTLCFNAFITHLKIVMNFVSGILLIPEKTSILFSRKTYPVVKVTRNSLSFSIERQLGMSYPVLHQARNDSVLVIEKPDQFEESIACSFCCRIPCFRR